MRFASVFFGLILGASALSQVTKYAQTTTSIRAGVVLLDANKLPGGVPDNSTPFIFYNFDQSSAGKPNGWAFFNPSAPTIVTDAISTRWNTILGAGNGPNLGDKVRRDQASYWEVPLSSASDAQLANFDVLAVPVYKNISLTPYERERLRQFVDQGGLLWIDLDTSSLAQDPMNGFPLPFQTASNALPLSTNSDFFHPLLSSPNQITNSQLQSMLYQSTGSVQTYNVTATSTSSPLFLSAMGPTTLGFLGFVNMSSVVDELNGASAVTGSIVALGQIGDGNIVVTSRAMARTMNQVRQPDGSYNANAGYTALQPTYDKGALAVESLLVNGLSLGSTYGQVGHASRKTSSTTTDFGPPLLKKFATEVPYTADTRYPPVFFKGLMVVLTGQTLSVYDANPDADLDGDGNPDDGVQDYALGSKQDLLWTYTFAAGVQLSPPTCIDVPNPTAGAPKDQIVLVDNMGQLYAFDAFNLSGGNISGTSPGAPAYAVTPATAADVSGKPGSYPLAPTYQEGLLYLADNQTSQGRITVIDPANKAVYDPNGASPWFFGGTVSPNIAEISASPTIGYIPVIDSSGGLDKVMYIPTLPTLSASAGVASIWLGVKGEQPKSWSVEPGNVLRINTRASEQGLDIFEPFNKTVSNPSSVRLTVIKTTGDVYTQTEMDGLFNGNWTQNGGVVDFTMTGGALPADVAGFRIDYTLDIGKIAAAGTSASLIRGSLQVPDDSNRTKRILDNIALGADGTFFFVASTGNASTLATSGGALYAVQEFGRAAFNLRYRYEMYGQHLESLEGAPAVTLKPVFGDADGIQQFSAFLQGDLQNLTFVGGPVYSKGKIVALATGAKPTGVPVSVLMTFDADPPVMQIPVSGAPAGTFNILQYDISASDVKNNPTKLIVMDPNSYTYEKEPSSPTGYLRLNSAMSSVSGLITNAFSSSQPVVFKQTGAPDAVIWPDQVGGKWSPLISYTVLPGYQGTSRPFVTGDSMYMSGASAIPDILTTGAITNSGVVFAMSTNPSAGQFSVPDPYHPWQTQAIQVVYNTPTDIQTNPAVLWPQAATSVEIYRTRLLQTKIGAATALGVVGGENTLGVWSNDGVSAFAKTDFIVCDSNRVASIDSSGNPDWIMESSLKTGTESDTGQVADSVPFVRPVKAYPNGNDVVVVDAGANRVVETDSGGREVRSLTGFQLDPTFRPDGYQSSEPATFNEPSDVLLSTGYVAVANNPLNTPGVLEYWKHYFVADRGNGRLLDIVDRYNVDANRRVLGPVVISGAAQLGVLYSHSPATFSGKGFEYNSLARVYVPGVNARYIVAAGIGPSMPTAESTGLSSGSSASPGESQVGNSAIVLFDGANTQVINSYNVDAVPSDVFWDDTSAAFASPARSARMGTRIQSLRSISLQNRPDGLGGTTLAIMFADNSGVFELVPDAVNGGYKVSWELPTNVYKYVRGVNETYAVTPGAPDLTNPMNFRPTFAKRLNNGEILIVNGIYGFLRDGNTSFHGEVLEVSGDLDQSSGGLGTTTIAGFNLNKKNFGFGTSSIRFSLPAVQGTRSLLLPVFAYRK